MKFDHYSVGDRIGEGELAIGTVAAMACHPTRAGYGYIMVRHIDGTYTIYCALRNASCSLFLTRFIPAAVMRSMFKQVFENSEEPCAPVFEGEHQRRYPVTDENWGKAKQEVAPVVTEQDAPTEEPVQEIPAPQYPEGPYVDCP